MIHPAGNHTGRRYLLFGSGTVRNWLARRSWIFVLAVVGCLPLIFLSCTRQPGWWKGNLHTHSYWSDGDDYPEMIVGWYKNNGYDFIALSDHNILAEGERWINVSEIPGGQAVHRRYVERFGPDWVDERVQNGDTLVRLKTLAEYRTLFEEPGEFLTIKSEEITDRFEEKPIHVNATNIETLIEPQGGGSVLEVMQNNIDAVLDQRRRTGRPMMPHLNHPNFRWAVTAEEIAALDGERFFEVYNGHPLVNNEGDLLHPSTDQMWDFILDSRLRAQKGVMYGLAVDDAHNYRVSDSSKANPGRGWVMVRAPGLTPAAIIAALESGAFYSSTGVALDEVRWDGRTLTVEIRPEEGVTYETTFLGSRDDSGADSDKVLARVDGATASYTLEGGELYVRAKVMSSKPKQNGIREGEVEVAWTQPVVPERAE